MLRRQILTLCLGMAIATLATVAQAAHLLEVDLSVPNQVTITGTNNPSLATVSGPVFTGVYFEDFYGGPGGALVNNLIAGDLTNVGNPSDNSPSLFRGGAGSDPGLNLWSWSPDVTVSFTAGSPAFTGSGTWSLTAAEYGEMLAGSTSGNLYFPADTVDDLSSATVIGEYLVVPEPATISLVLLGFVALIRRR